MRFVLRLAAAVVMSGALYAAALALGPLAAPCLLLVPLPGLVLATRESFVSAGLWCCSTMGLVTLALGAEATPAFAFALGLPALAIAAGVRRCWSFERIALVGIGAWMAGIGCLAGLAYGGDVAAMISAAREQLSNSVTLALAGAGSADGLSAVAPLVDADREALLNALLQIFPALIVLTGAFTVLANLLLLRSLTAAVHDVNLRRWRAPDALIWGLIVAGFGMFLTVPWVSLTARNFFVVILGCYLCQGLAIVAYYLDRFRLPRAIRVVGYALIALQHVATAMVLALGVFDLWGDFRRLSAGPADVRFNADNE